MLKRLTFLTMLLIIFIVSCRKNDDTELTDKKIPIDSIYFTCKINNKLIEFKSPSAKFSSWSKAVKRLYKLKNNTKDSVIIEYTQEYHDDNYIIGFRFSNSFIVDTLNILWDAPNVKEYLYKKGTIPFQFLTLDFGLDEITPKYCGFKIYIYDRLNYINYSSNIDYRQHANTNKYVDFVDKSLFQITNSFRLDSIKNSIADISDNWFIEANFNCNLYDISDTNKIVFLSGGILKGCF